MKRGRPKGSKNKKKLFKKRGRGRPRGNKNKIQKGKRGRPKGSKNKVKEDLSHIKISTSLGHCSCKTVIIKKDLISKNIYVCPHCGKKANIKTLTHALNKDNVGMSRKEYLENVVNAKHIDSAPLLKVIDKSIIGENIDLKGFEIDDREKE